MELDTIPVSEYISGKSIFDNLDYVWKCSVLGDYTNINYPPDTSPIIIYCHTDHINDIFSKMSRYKNRFILISHNSDGKVTYTPKMASDGDLNKLPQNLLYGFCQNLLESHNKISSLPIGLENSYWSSENKQLQIYNKIREPRQIKNLCYLNVNPATNPTERSSLYNMLKTSPWVTSQHGKNGHCFSTYIDNIRNHEFVLCPEGNQNGHTGGYGAMGSHRVWETLYTGSIPVVKRGVQSNYFSDLPILFIDNWDIISQDFLENELDRFYNNTYNLDKLLLSYWTNLIYSRYIDLMELR